MTSRHVGLCIATYRRPEGLQKLLDAVAELDWDGALTIVVADNDPVDQEGVEVCEALPSTYPWPVVTTVVEEPGIPFPRNAAIQIALEHNADYLAFLDDDEWPPKSWLKSLVGTLEIGADLAGGPQAPVFPKGTSELLRNNSYYGHDQGLADGQLCVLQSSGNFVITAEALQNVEPPWFAPKYAQASGADHDLFRKLEKAGALMRWSSKAFVWEDIPPHRLTETWMKERVVEIHNGRVRIDREHFPGVVPTLTRATKTFALGVTAVAASVVGIGNEQRSYDAQLLRWKFQGKMVAHVGVVVDRKEDRVGTSLPATESR